MPILDLFILKKKINKTLLKRNPIILELYLITLNNLVSFSNSKEEQYKYYKEIKDLCVFINENSSIISKNICENILDIN